LYQKFFPLSNEQAEISTDFYLKQSFRGLNGMK